MTFIAVRPTYGGMLVFAAWLVLMGSYEIVGRLLIQVEGTIVSSETSSGGRAATWYHVRGPDGRIREYIAGSTDKSLPTRMPVGTYIKKNKYELAYMRDGQKINDFQWAFYSILILAGLSLARLAHSRFGRGVRSQGQN